MNKKISIVIFSIIVIILIGLIVYFNTSFANNDDNETINLTEKISEEIKYMESEIISSMHKLNNISVASYKVYTKEINEPESNDEESKSSSQQGEGQGSSSGASQQESKSSEGNQSGGQLSDSNSKTNQISASEIVKDSVTNTNYDEINWDEISFDIENLYSTWPTMNLDLKELGVDDTTINNYNVSLNGLIQALEGKDKTNCLVNLYNMYLGLTKFEQVISQDANTVNLFNTKLNILYAYVLASTSEKWEDVNSSLNSAKENLSSILTTLNDKKNKSNYNKINVILQELQNASQVNNKNLFILNYKNIIQELETL